MELLTDNPAASPAFETLVLRNRISGRRRLIRLLPVLAAKALRRQTVQRPSPTSSLPVTAGPRHAKPAKLTPYGTPIAARVAYE